MTVISTVLNRPGSSSAEPLYRQLYRQIKSEIIEGIYPYNAKLPSKRRLAANLQCSLNTVQNAYGQLAAEGYIIARCRSGYYVCKLDGIVNITTESAAVPDENVTGTEYRYDFSHYGVEHESFPFPTWRRLTREAINEYDTELLKPCGPYGYYKLRCAISDYLWYSRGVKCSPERVIISSGTEFLIQMLIQLFDKDCVYALEDPGYEKLSLVFKSNRAAYTTISLDEDGMKPDMLAGSGADIACVTPSHQFPTGTIMPVSRRIQLLNWANEKPGRFIVEDDYDSEFRYGGRPIPSLQGLDKGDKVIYIGAFSKSLAPSVRVSYMVLPGPLLKDYSERLDFYICPVPLAEQKVLYRFISGGYFERHLNRMRNIYRKKREILVASIRRLLPYTEISGANAGLHIVLEVRNGMSEAELLRAAGEKGVRVYGLSGFYSSSAALCSHDGGNDDAGTIDCPSLLLGFASLRAEDIDAAVGLLREAFQSSVR